MKKLIYVLTAVAAVLTAVSCNSSYEPGEDTATSVAVYSFGLQADKKVMEHLDTVFFSIDLVNARIFNADSLPYGADVRKLVPKIKTLDGVSQAQLSVRKYTGTDTVYNYITNPNDSIDFTNPVTLMIVSPDGLVSRQYTIKVNVHTQKPDSLVWSRADCRNLPSAFAIPIWQQTARTDAGFWCLSANSAGAMSLAHAADPDGRWDVVTPVLPQGADRESFSGAGDKLYVISDGELMSSADGLSWTATGTHMDHVFGALDGELIGYVRDNGTRRWVSTSGASGALPDGVPYQGESTAAQIDFELSASGQLIIAGGLGASGERLASAWGFDGRNWAVLCRELPEALEGAIVLNYTTYKMDSAYKPVALSTLIMMGGRDATEVNRDVYVSYTWGTTWEKAGELMAMPKDVPSWWGAQAFVADVTLGSRATRPIESWECPYIYVFGGNNFAGALYNTVWRATLNRTKFKPVQ